jgi:NADH:ubiquinone oxidoreductase subunit E
MKSAPIKSKLEVFVCNHEDCAQRGAKDLTSKLKKWCKQRPDKDIRVYRCGCLGHCSEGIAIACYPEKKFLLKVKEDDYKQIKEQLEQSLLQLKS